MSEPTPFHHFPPQMLVGHIRWRRSDSDDCVCCEGNHVYGRFLEAAGAEVQWYYWLADQLRLLPENAVVRISVEGWEQG